MDEYIEREALKQKIVDEQTENHVGIGNAGYEIGYHNGLSMAMAMMLTAPAADVVSVVHGRWIEKEELYFDVMYDCSACGESFCFIEGNPSNNLYNYCPNCGARMDGE